MSSKQGLERCGAGWYVLATVCYLGFLFLFMWTTTPEVAKRVCEDRDPSQCARSRTNMFSTVCLLCARESACLGVTCGSNFSEFLARCGSTDFIDNCYAQPDLRLAWTLTLLFSFVCSLDATLYTNIPKRKRWQCEAGFVCLVIVCGMAGTLAIGIVDPDQLGLALLVAVSPSVFSMPYLLNFSSGAELRAGLRRLLFVLLVGSLAVLQVIEEDAAHSWTIFLALCLSSFFCFVLLCAHDVREEALGRLGCAPLQLTKRDNLLIIAWLTSLVGALFWHDLRRSCSALLVVVAVLMLALFMQHEVTSTCFKRSLVTLFSLEVLATALTFLCEVCLRASPATLDLLGLVSFLLALAACVCFLYLFFHMRDPDGYAQYFRSRNKQLLRELLSDAARVVEAYVQDTGSGLLLDYEPPTTTTTPPIFENEIGGRGEEMISLSLGHPKNKNQAVGGRTS